jgi:two-component system sensor histidine kinase SenX3
MEGIFLSSLEGRRIPVTFSALPVRAGSTEFCLYMVTDHTLSRDMNTFRKEFISLISHDLKNPVSMIATYGELLKAGAETRPEDERLFLEQILLASSILSIQINNIVNAARLLNGILTFDSSFVDLGQVVVDTVNLIDPQGRAREIGFTRVVDDSLWVHGDTMKLQEVIINLLSNAVRYSPKGSTILVEALKKGGTVQFAVTDKGKGLAMDELQVYCQPFQKGRGERSGAGLGLFIATEYLKAHTTELNIESRPGEGCKASFSLPLSPPDGLEGEP